MAKRDPEKTARNRIIKELSEQLKKMLPSVLKATEANDELSLHAYFATRKAKYIDLKNEVIPSAEHYISLFIRGLKEDLTSGEKTAYTRFYENLKKSKISKKYLAIFLERTFLREYDNISKVRPDEESSEIWIGQNNADYGLLVTPRFRNNLWENDKSEIRRFKPRYWSIGHILETGLVIPDKNKFQTFKSVGDYLDFFENVLVRQTGSCYQIEVAELYSAYVRKADNPEDILLLIPELRFQKEKAHKYRLDFCIIDVESNNKIGFELSPSSSHAKITGIKKEKKTQQQINAEVAKIFDAEMKKHKDYFRRKGIFTLIYTDSDLSNINNIFLDIEKYLLPNKAGAQLQLHLLSEFFD